jgi:hypothetical protein
VLRILDDAWERVHGARLGLHGGGNGHRRGTSVYRWASDACPDDPLRAVLESAERFAREADGRIKSPLAAWSSAPGRWYGKGLLTREQRADRSAELKRLCAEARQKSDEARTRGDAVAEKKWDEKWRSLCVESKALAESAA